MTPREVDLHLLSEILEQTSVPRSSPRRLNGDRRGIRFLAAAVLHDLDVSRRLCLRFCRRQLFEPSQN